MAMVPTLLNVNAVTPTTSMTFKNISTTGKIDSAEDISVTTVGKGLKIKEGVNAKMGKATLALGTVTVANTAVTANSRIFLTPQSGLLNAGAIAITARTPGINFVIGSTNLLDAREVAWMMVDSA